MQTSVNLQEPFTYSLIPVVIVVIMIAFISIYFIYKKIKNKAKINDVKDEKIPKKIKLNIPEIKNKYLKQLDLIQSQYFNNKIELREAYQQISSEMRLFVFEMTDIKTQNYSLAEIKELNLPILYELIEEYYEPEFASKSVGDFNASITKARRVISEWN